MNKRLVILFGFGACLLYGIGAGLRADIGILMQSILSQTGLEYDTVSFCIAAMQLVFGASQPVFGLIAAKRSNRSVLTTGAILIIAGLTGIGASHSFVLLFLSLSVLFGLGAGAVSFGLVFTSSVYFVGKENAMLISGMLNAAAGMVGFIFSPLLNHLIETSGLSGGLLVISVIAAAMIPVAIVVTSRDPSPVRGRGKGHDAESESVKKVNAGSLVREAVGNRTYMLLVAGFSTCGFHMVIIESHLFSQFESYGVPGSSASWAFSIYGIATIAGALLSGVLCTKTRKGSLLTFYYGFRAVWVLVYLFLLPKNVFTAVLFSIGLGMTRDATVSPTSGLVNKEFSIEKVATLVGFLFLCHQIGAFFSAWGGGILLKVTGGYQAIWMVDVLLCAFAALASSRIEKNVRTENNTR